MDIAKEIARNMPSTEDLLRAIGAHTKNLPSTEDLLRAIGSHGGRNHGSDLLPSVALFGAGLLVGAGLALLLAPTSGRELREDIGEYASDLRDRAAQKVGAVGEEDENGSRASHEVA
jgi:hypothetical protein